MLRDVLLDDGGDEGAVGQDYAPPLQSVSY